MDMPTNKLLIRMNRQEIKVINNQIERLNAKKQNIRSKIDKLKK